MCSDNGNNAPLVSFVVNSHNVGSDRIIDEEFNRNSMDYLQ